MSQDRIAPDLPDNSPQSEEKQEKPNFDAYDYQMPSQERNQTRDISPYVAIGSGLLLFAIVVICSCIYFFTPQDKTNDLTLPATLTLGQDAKINVSPSEWTSLPVSSQLTKDQIIKTGSEKVYLIELPGGATLRAYAHTSFKFNKVKKENDKTFIEVTLYKGKLFAANTSDTKISLSTKYCNITPLDAKYMVSQQTSGAATEQSQIVVSQGQVTVIRTANSSVKFKLRAGQQLEISENSANKPHQAEKDTWFTWNNQWNRLSDIQTKYGIKIDERILEPQTKKKKKIVSTPNNPIEDRTNDMQEDADFQRFRDKKAWQPNLDQSFDAAETTQVPANDDDDFAPSIPTNLEPEPPYTPPQAVPAPTPVPTPPKTEQSYPRYEGKKASQPPRRPYSQPPKTPKVYRHRPQENIPPLQVAPPPAIPELPKVGGKNRRNDPDLGLDPLENTPQNKRDRNPRMRLDANGFMYPEHDFDGAATNKSGDPLDAITDTSKDVLKAKPPSSKALDAATYR